MSLARESSAVPRSAVFPGPGASSFEIRRSKFAAALAALVLVGAVLLAYQPVWDAGFIWDDDDYVTANHLLTAPDGWRRIWFSTDAPSQYFPLVYSTFRLEHALWGLHAPAYHWVNLLFHAANAVLAWRLFARLGVPGAWFGAALFALHPVNVESAAWITQLKNTQSLALVLLALHAWTAFVDRGGWQPYALALACGALALFAKTTACTLPAALLLVVWLRGRALGRTRFVQVLPFLACGVAMGLVSVWWERHRQGTVGEIYQMNLLERLLVATRAVWFYLGKLVWPADLSFNYPLWRIDAADPRAYAGLAAGLALAGAIAWARRFVGRSLETAALYYVATLGPLLGFFMLYTFKYTFVADHYQYPATLGPCALAAAALVCAGRRWWPRTAWLTAALGGAILAACAVATWRQSRVYENLETLWSATVAANPESYMGHNNLGSIRLGQGRVDEAIAHFRRALELRPGHDNALANLGGALLRAGRPDEALIPLRELATAAPGDWAVHRALAEAWIALGRADAALAPARRVAALRPDDAEAHRLLAALLLHFGDVRGSLGHQRRVHALAPDDPAAAAGLGWTLATATDDTLRDGPEALRLARDAQRRGGDADPAVWRLLAAAQAETGDFAAATASVRRAVELAAARGDEPLAELARAQLALHESGRPWRESAAPAGEGSAP